MRILFLQLASPSFEPADQRANVPLAAGNLAACLRAPRGADTHSVEVLDRDLLDRAGDAALVRALVDRAPDLVGASLYCWSSFRTLAVLARARALAPGLRVVVGGPEVDRGNAFLAEHAGRSFDFAAAGEGEELMADLVDDVAAGGDGRAVAGIGRVTGPGAIDWSPPRSPVADLARLPSPYLEGLFPLRARGVAHLETARGCLFECEFCFYHADYRKVRTFPRERVGAEVTHALEQGVRDLYLMDPTFNGHSGYRETLRALRPALLDRGARVHTELRAEPLTRAVVGELADAGITTVEVGLQTVTTESLAAVGRTFDRARFARGCRELLRAGIGVEIGTIVGLPGDTPEGMRRTFLYARDECGEEAETVPFVLSLLPATVLRERAGSFGIEHRHHPPYALARSPGWDEEAIRATLRDWSAIFGRELDPIPTVRLVERGGAESADLAPGDLVRRLVVEPARASREELRAAGRALAERVEATVALVGRGLRSAADVEALAELARPIRDANPHGLLEIVLEPVAPFDVPAAAASLRRALPPVEGHYLNEHLRALAPEGADLSLRIVAVVPVAAFETWGRPIAASLPVLWHARVASLEALDDLLDGPFASGALLLELDASVAAQDAAARAGDDADDLRFRESGAQRAVDAAVSEHAVPPETVVLLGDGARVVAVRRGI